MNNVVRMVTIGVDFQPGCLANSNGKQKRHKNNKVRFTRFHCQKALRHQRVSELQKRLNQKREREDFEAFQTVL
jgi:hypothetical protein